MPSSRLIPPAGGVVVRMYRIGHGDCFLLAFPGETAAEPVYVLIDCGYKPGSPAKLTASTPAEVAADIRAATGGRVDVVVITHEHQDHVNAFTAGHFGTASNGLKVSHMWLAWTEDPDDADANALRRAYADRLLGLAAARTRLAAAGDSKRVKQIDEFLAIELGDETPTALAAAAADPAKSQNKKAMKLVKDRADHIEYLRPHRKPLAVPGSPDVRAFVLGPPRNPDALKDLDPVGDEEFHLAVSRQSPAAYFAAAARSAGPPTENRSPFARCYGVPLAGAFQHADYGKFFSRHYGTAATAPEFSVAADDRLSTTDPSTEEMTPDNAPFRRIDNDWLHSAERLALAMNDETNNASLVLAFELGKGGKVLLFAADAQRGNWVSWADNDFSDGGQRVSAKELLGRTVLYKVGHHCSHNATLNGGPDSPAPSLGWMARDESADEFTALITAVRKWAETQNGWDHPRKEIKDRLIEKAAGRVLQTDTDLDDVKKPANVSPAAWQQFLARVKENPLYFDLTVTI